MAGLSGTELTEKFRQFDRITPVLFYSGAVYEADKEAARVSGAQGYLVKPATGEELIAEVVRLIAESKPSGLSKWLCRRSLRRHFNPRYAALSNWSKTSLSLLKSIGLVRNSLKPASIA